MKIVILMSVLILTGCAGRPMTFSSKVDPYPADYRELAVFFVGTDKPTRAQVSEPRKMTAWSLTDATGWYICLREAGKSEILLAIFDDKISGTIQSPAVNLCAGGVFHDLQLEGAE